MEQQEIFELDSQYIMQTYARFPVAIESGSGCEVTGADGRKYLDFTSGIGVNCLGYADEGWVKAVSEQAGKLAHISNLYHTEVGVKLAKYLVDLSALEGKVFFSNSGAEANEGVIKLARKYSFDKYGAGRSTIVTLKNSFHGRTVTTLSATGQDVFHNFFFPFTEGFRYAQPNDINELKTFGKDVCAVMLELIQGEGGVLPLDKAYVNEVFALAKERDWLVLIDEVQTGVGRTGDMFAYQNYGVKPDAFTLAKGLGGGLPIGVVVCSKRLGDILTKGTHASTYGANPIACAGASYVLNKVSQPEFLKEVSEKGEYIKQKLLKIPAVKEVRGKGLMIGIELSEGIDARVICDKLIEKGMIALTAKTALRLLPPLSIDYKTIDAGMEILMEVLQ